MSDEHPARRRYRLVYELRNERGRSHCLPEEATHVSVEMNSRHGWSGVTFELPAERTKLWSVQALLERAYDAGKADAQKRMRDALNI
jgi:hypothetical protein